MERVTGEPWTDEQREVLRERWQAGATATDIQRELGAVSRSAVMGMVNRMGLTRVKRGPRKTDPETALNDRQKSEIDCDDQAEDMAAMDADGGWEEAFIRTREAIFHMGYDEKVGNVHPDDETMHLLDLDRELVFLMFAARFGPDPETLRKAALRFLTSDADHVDQMVERFTASGIWPAGASSPQRWDEPDLAGPAMILDAMAVAGWLMVEHDERGPAYRIRPVNPDSVKPRRV